MRVRATLPLFLICCLAACASVSVPLQPAPRIGYGMPEDQPPYELEPSDVIELHILNKSRPQRAGDRRAGTAA